MILADTSVWIEFLKGREKYFESFDDLLKQKQIIAVECVFGELLQGTRSHEERELIRAYWEHLPKIDDRGLWLVAGEFSSDGQWHSKGVGLIDLFLYAVARKYQFRIWTLDKKLKSLFSTDEIFDRV